MCEGQVPGSYKSLDTPFSQPPPPLPLPERQN